MPNSSRKHPVPKADDELPADFAKQKSGGRNGLIKDEFDTDCWEPSLKDRLRRATGRDKP